MQFAVLTTPLLTFNITFFVPKLIYRIFIIIIFRSFYEYAHVLEPLYDFCVILGNIKIKDLKFDKKCLIDGILILRISKFIVKKASADIL